jgi:hypothetical protein
MALVIDEKLRLKIQRWEKVLIVRTLNGFILAKPDCHAEPVLTAGIVCTSVRELQDYLDVWGGVTEVKPEDEDED